MGAAIQRSTSRYGKRRVDVKTTKTSVLVVIGWCVAWTPYTVIALLGILTDRSLLTPQVAHLPALFAKTAAVYNPISKHNATRSVCSYKPSTKQKFSHKKPLSRTAPFWRLRLRICLLVCHKCLPSDRMIKHNKPNA
nr:rhabdomeric opsin [Macrobiotus sp.]QYF06621.1 rhabdomeric opsin [Macrobiotus sp.]